LHHRTKAARGYVVNRGASYADGKIIYSLLDATVVAVDIETGPRKRTALHGAIFSGSPETVRAILRAGADANKADTFGETALHLLARAPLPQSADIARALLAGGADPRRTDARGFTVAHAAAAADDVPLLRAVLDGAALDGANTDILTRTTPSGETPLEIALRYRRDRAAEILLQAGSNPREADPWPPLHASARMDNVARASALLASGADLTRVFDGKTALEVARDCGSRRVEALLASAAAAASTPAPPSRAHETAAP